MRKYEKYKDSGIEWVGEIPINWDKLKIGRTFHKIGSGTTPNTNRDEYYVNGNINWLNTGDLNDTYINDTNKKITKVALNEISTLREFEEDSIVIALYGATIGKLGHLKIKTSTNQACCVLSDSEKIKNRFLFYCLLTARDFIISKSYGGGQPNISQELIKQLYLPAPSLSEQTQISRYLDHQTAIIDSLIAKKEKLVALLKEQRQAIINEAVTKGLNPKAKMKDSGIEWLGEVPEDWEVVKLKWISEIYAGGTPSTAIDEYWFNGTIPWLNSGSINQRRITEASKFITEEALKNSSTRWVPKNAILMALAGQGKTKGTVALLEFDATCNQSMAAIIPKKKKIYNEFLFYWLDSNYERIRGLAGNEQRDGLNLVIVGGIHCPLPKIHEQIEIAHFLRDFDIKEQQVSNNIQIEIDKLKEYRQSIISEAVTGKVDVRDWQPAEKKLAT